MHPYIDRLDTFLRNHWIGIVLVSVVTGVVGNFAYDFVKPKEAGPTTSTEPRVDPQLSAQAIRASASTVRSIAASHMRSPAPVQWNEAERLYKIGTERYANSDFQGAYMSFKAAYHIYNDLYEQAKVEGH